MSALTEAHEDLAVAADALTAFVRGEDSSDAAVGALLLAEHVLLIRNFLAKK